MTEGNGLNIEYLNTRTSKETYDILTALRGPDGKANWRVLICLKSTVTARLRTIVFLHYAGVRSAMFTSGPLTEAEVDRLRAVLIPCKRKPRHVIVHLLNAVEATCDHAIWGGQGPYLVRVLTRALLNLRD